MDTPVQTLSGHKRKVGTINFHPTANNVVGTTSSDFTAKIWDVETGQVKNDVAGHSDIITSSCWDYVGNTYLTSSKDKNIRILDPRAGQISSTFEAHQGVKGMRVSYLGNKEKIFTMGFSKMSERQYSIWDPKNLAAPLKSENIDTSSGLMMPFYDNDTSVLYLAGKGDGNIRYFELVDEAPYIHYLSEYKSSTPQRGMAAVPKLAMDLGSCEITRLLKVCASSIEPIHFNVPRKSDIFQDDLYPPTNSGEPSLTSAEWFNGGTGSYKLISLAPGFVAPTVASTDFKTVTVDKKERSVKELEDENHKQANRIAYLEAELAKKDAQIKSLGGN
jgi:coronin-1B/1C/6